MAVSFKGAHFPQDIILTCVRWYVAYPLSYRHVEELMQEQRGVRRFSLFTPLQQGTVERVVVAQRRTYGETHRRDAEVFPFPFRIGGYRGVSAYSASRR